MISMSLARLLNKKWLRLVLLVWLCTVAWRFYVSAGAIHWFALGDTDDNLRMVQVRDWLAGQGWYDLRQYRLNAPDGANIHWSRLVDLPIAGLILLLQPFVGMTQAAKYAAAFAPLLPLFVVMLGLAITVRRLAGPLAYLPMLLMLLLSSNLMAMFSPLRIDHHGWQLAMVALSMMGLSDPRAARGGFVVGIAAALSFTIGIEMLPFLALFGVSIALRWIFEGKDALRLRCYGAALSGGVALGFVLFASEANRAFRCDALTPVWLSTLVVAGGLAVALSFARPASWRGRFMIAVAAGGIIAAFYALSWPHCLSNLEGISDEAKRTWLSNIREVRPIYLQSPAYIFRQSVLLIPALAGYALLIIRTRGTPRFAPVLSLAVCALVAALLLFYQSRMAASAQLLALPGMAALLAAAPLFLKHQWARILTLILAIGIAGWQLGLAEKLGLPSSGNGLSNRQVGARKSDARCSTMPSHAPLNRLAPAKFFTFVDLSPRFITLTHHSAITGPYHRNDRLILDVHKVFRAAPAEARSIITRHKAQYVMVCPGSSESTIFMRDAPDGFYAQLAAGKTLDWLEPVALPKGNPFRVWRVKL